MLYKGHLGNLNVSEGAGRTMNAQTWSHDISVFSEVDIKWIIASLV